MKISRKPSSVKGFSITCQGIENMSIVYGLTMMKNGYQRHPAIQESSHSQRIVIRASMNHLEHIKLCKLLMN